MAETENGTPPRRGRFLVGFLLLAMFIGIAAAVISIFQVGILVGLAAAGGVVVACAVPARMLGWPFPGLGDLVALVLGIVGAIAALFLAIFD